MQEQRRCRWPALLLVLLTLLPGSVAHAQPEPAGAGTAPAAEGDAGVSIAEAFFISRRTNADGEKSVEVLGSLIIWFLLLLSALSIGLIGFMSLTNQRKSIIPEGVVDAVRQMLGAGKFRDALELARQDESYFSQVLHAGLHEASHGYSAMIRSLEQTSDELTTRRLRRIEYLNVLGQVSPMIGLLGTVYGMILAFRAIVITGGNADPVLLAGGIGTALTTTFWGLVVGIPALAGYAIIRNRIDELTTEATLVAEEIVNQFRPRSSSRASAEQGGGGPTPRPRSSAP